MSGGIAGLHYSTERNGTVITLLETLIIENVDVADVRSRAGYSWSEYAGSIRQQL